MEDAKEPTVENPKSIASLAGVVAAGATALSGLIALLEIEGSWAFGRGLFSAIGFPLSVLGLKSSTDMFFGVASQYALVFIVALALGFIRKQGVTSSRSVGLALLILLLAVDITWTSEPSSGTFKLLAMIAALGSPALIGRTVLWSRDLRLRAFYGVFASLVALSLYSDQLYAFGQDTGRNLNEKGSVESKSLAWSEKGMAAAKLRDYPFVKIYSLERLTLKTAPVMVLQGFSYSPQGQNFLRFIFADEDKYYLIENNSGRSQPIAISKTVVTQIEFLKD